MKVLKDTSLDSYRESYLPIEITVNNFEELFERKLSHSWFIYSARTQAGISLKLRNFT